MAASLRVESEILRISKGIEASLMVEIKVAVGEHLLEAFRRRIQEGDSSWAPLSEGWIKIKGHSRPWEHEGRLYRGLDMGVSLEDVRVGLLGGEGLSDLPVIGASLEYGTSTIEARPLLGPVFGEEQVNIVGMVRESIEAKLKRVEV